MADIGWSLSGIDTERWRVQAGSLWRPPVTVRRDVLTIPGRHGTIPTGKPPVFEEPIVTLEFLCEGTQADLEELANELTGLLAMPGLTLGRYSGGLVTDAAAQFVSLSTGEFVPGVGAFFTASLAVPGVFLRTPSVDSAPVVVTDGAVVTVATLAGSTAPIADTILRVRGSATSVQIVDPVTGTGLSWAGTALGTGEFLFLDAANLTARRNASATDWTTGGDVVTGQLSYPGVGPLQAWPRMEGADPSDRRVKLTVTGTGFGATTTLTVRARPAYL